MMKALAHPAPIAIIQQLLKANACICGDLVDELGLAQATISQHLKELKNAGLMYFGTRNSANQRVSGHAVLTVYTSAIGAKQLTNAHQTIHIRLQTF